MSAKGKTETLALALRLQDEFYKKSRPLSKSQLEAARRYSPTTLEMRNIDSASAKKLLRDILKTYSLEQQAQVWSHVYELSICRELDSLVIDFFKFHAKKKNFPLEHFAETIYLFIPKIDCWVTGDMLSYLTSYIHERWPKKYYPVLEKFSSSTSPWERRMALLGLYYYSACRENYPSVKKTLALIGPQLEVDHYYLQKAVGWTLREMGNVYPEEAKNFIDKNLAKISSHAFSSATEKIKGKVKEDWKKRRKELRKKIKKSL